MTAESPACQPMPLPDRRVAPGVLAIPIEIVGSDLRHVFVYALECDGGVMLVDAGWGGERSLHRLESGLAALGHSLADVVGVLITHNHSDHYGLAARLQAESGAWLAMHPADAAQLQLRYGPREHFRAVLGHWLRSCGVPEELVGELASAAMYGDGVEIVEPDRPVVHGDELRLGGRRIEVIHTPGHTPGHLVFALPDEGVLFTGDHVLPRITPNVSAGPLGSPDPLASYLDSLAALKGLGEVQVLPAHVDQFDDLPGRVAELRQHHLQRLDETARCLAEGASTVWQVATSLRWSRPLDRFPAFLQRAALGEAHAHLQRLVGERRATVTAGPPQRWQLTAGRS